MSYDVSIVAGCCGAHGHNITSNLRPMFNEADLHLPDLHGKRAGRAVAEIASALREMARDPERFRAHNPENGWGDYDGALAFLAELAADCATHPEGEVHVSW